MVERVGIFRYKVEMRDAISNNRLLVQSFNDVEKTANKTSIQMKNTAESIEGAGKKTATAAINFQTATQGMLNLTTAGVQTYTSFSNLDRAANRLAQAQVGVARAQDLLNNKQLRLNELQEKGLGSTAKAVQLQKELATARADLAVKTDKLKIEEGALTDIQLLFATNVANVMISSLQTIKSLKDLNIVSTIKATATQKLHNLAILESIPPITVQDGAMKKYITTAKTVVNTNRLLTLSIPVIGVALAGVTVALQAYNENWGGFRDGVQSVIPLLKDHKSLLHEVQDELDSGNTVLNDYNKGLDQNASAMTSLPQKYKLVIDKIKELKEESKEATDVVFKLNKFVSQTGTISPSGFSTPSLGGLPTAGGQVIQTPLGIHQLATSNTNVVRTETDSSFTAKAVRQSSSSIHLPSTTDVIKFAAAGVITPYNPSIVAAQKKKQAVIAVPTASGQSVFARGSPYDLLNIFEPSTLAGQAAKAEIELYSEIFSGIGESLDKFRRDFNLAQRLASMKTGETPAYIPTGGEYYQRLGQRAGGDITASLQGIETLFTGITKEQKDIYNQIKGRPGIGNILFSLEEYLRSVRMEFVSELFQNGQRFGGWQGGFSQAYDAAKTEEEKLAVLYQTFTADPKEALNRLLEMERQDEILKGFSAYYSEYDYLKGKLPEGTFSAEYMKTLGPTEYAAFLKEQEQKRQMQEIEDAIQRELKNREISRKRDIEIAAANAGLSVDEYVRRVSYRGLYQTVTGAGLPYKGGLISGALTTEQIKQLGGIIRIGGDIVYMDDKAKFAASERRRALAGKRDYGDDIFMNLVQEALNAQFVLGQRTGVDITGFGSYGGLGFGTGLILSNDDPRLRDTSQMGPIQLEVFKKTGMDIGRVAESMPLKEAERIANLEKNLGRYANTTGGRSGTAGMYLAENGGLTISQSAYKHLKNIIGSTDKLGNALIASGAVSATQAYQIGRNARGESLVAVPSWVKAQIREQDAWRNSVIGQNAAAMYSMLTGAHFGGYSSSVAKQPGAGIPSHMAYAARAAGMLGIGISEDQYTPFATTASQIYDIIYPQLKLKMKENNVRQEFLYAALDSISLSVSDMYRRNLPIGFSAIRQPVAASQYRNEARATVASMLQGYVSRVAQGNFGQFDATILHALSGAVVGELAHETTVFNEKIAPILNIAHNDFKTTLVNPKRGINEIDDRIRWTQRLEQISTGATVF
jgi:hypothetical protein